MKKIILSIIFIMSCFSPIFVLAQVEKTEEFFKAKVLEILEEKNSEIEGKSSIQQKLKLMPLEGEYKGQEILFNGIGAYNIVSSNLYKKGDKVLVVASKNDQGEVNFYITDYVRTNGLFYLFLLFIIIVLLVGRLKGLKSLISLFLSFFIILKFILPYILSGSNPAVVTAIGSLFMISCIIYLTEGFKRSSHIAVLSIFISLLITILVSYFFVYLSRLNGVGSEEISYLIVLSDAVINFRGLLLAGIIIGALGVLDDTVLAQIATVEEIRKNSPLLNKKEIFESAFRVGLTHISSMTNTLFLAYAGASLPLLVLFVSGESAFSSLSQIVNNELIATEIVRTLSGSIGLVLSVPIVTFLAVFDKNK